MTFSINKLPLLEKFPKRQVTELVDFFEMCREDGLTNNQCQRCSAIVGVCQAPVVVGIHHFDFCFTVDTTMFRKSVRLNHD